MEAGRYTLTVGGIMRRAGVLYCIKRSELSVSIHLTLLLEDSPRPSSLTLLPPPPPPSLP